MDNEHDIDAWQAIRETPQDFLYGVGRQIEPQGNTEVGLTVAGAAVCEGAEETLAVFLAFVRAAAAMQKTWTPPDDDPEQDPSLSGEEFADQVDMPQAERPALLARLGLFLSREPWGRSGWHQPSPGGPWRAFFDRRVKEFRGVPSVDAYWSARPKPWEPQPLVRRAEEPAVMEIQPEQVNATFADAAVLPGYLLRWIGERTAGDPLGHVDLADLHDDLPAVHLVPAVRLLEHEGLIDVIWGPEYSDPSAALTASGLQKLQDVERRWRQRSWREPAARDAVMNWIYEAEEGVPTGYLPITGFFRHRRSVVDGFMFSVDDVDRASAYLAEQGLIEGLTVDQLRGPVQVRLTASGIDCMEKGLSVADYLDRRTGGTTNNFFGNISGSNLAWGDHATQHSTVNGVDAEGLKTLVDAVLHALPVMGLASPDQQAAEAAAADLAAEARAESPNPSRVHRVLRRLGAVLSNAGEQALSVVLKAAIDHVAASVGLPPGS
jgi:hypothetical protein